MWDTWLSISRRSTAVRVPLRMERASTSSVLRCGAWAQSSTGKRSSAAWSAKGRGGSFISSRKLSSSTTVGSFAWTTASSTLFVSSRRRW